MYVLGPGGIVSGPTFPEIRFPDDEDGTWKATPRQERLLHVQGELESFSRILERIEGIWATRELDVYLRKLFLDSRDGTRRGFPLPVANEILFLAEVNQYVRAFDVAERLGIPQAEALRMVCAGDEASLMADAFDDPTVSRDTAPRRTETRKGTSSSEGPQKSEQAPKAATWLDGSLSKGVVLVVVVLLVLVFLSRH